MRTLPDKFLVFFPSDGTYGLVFTHETSTGRAIGTVFSLVSRDAIRAQESGVPFINRNDLTEDDWRTINARSFLA